MVQREEESYVWTDTEAELHLNITLQYKANKTHEEAIWCISSSM